MNRKFTGLVLLFIAIQLVAMAIAGSHGHYRLNPYKVEDWLFCVAVATLTFIGLRLLFKKRVKNN